MKCFECKNEITSHEDVVLSTTRWFLCKHCHGPVLDSEIQDATHYLKKDINKVKKLSHLEEAESAIRRYFAKDTQ